MAIVNGNELNDYQEKIARLADGEPPRVLDLFAGCGGISLGFQHAGFNIIGGLESDPVAARTHANNIFKGNPGAYTIHQEARDITQYPPDVYMRKVLGVDSPWNQVEVIAGGPPCQAFARIGRAKLRQILKDPHAYLNDERASLYLAFLEYVEFFRPLAVLIENVPDIIRYGGKNVAHEIALTLDEMGYSCRYAILNAVLYGVPQHRMRFFLVAFLKNLNIIPAFPEPTHQADIPPGYKNQAMGMKIADPGAKYLFDPSDISDAYFIPAPPVPLSAHEGVTTQLALADLPVITYHLDGRRSTGPRKFDTLSPYRSNISLSDYAREMRSWSGFESESGIYDHEIRYLPRDYEIFRRMEPGDEYPRAHEIAEEIFKEHLIKEEQILGVSIPEGSPKYESLKKKYVPPYDPMKFPNKWWKLKANEPSRTLTAHLGKDTYSHIHYDSDQARVISVREAARLQSFPDGFRFAGAMNAAYRQIGNAVPPMLAYALAKHIKEQLNLSRQQSVPLQLNSDISLQVSEITDHGG